MRFRGGTTFLLVPNLTTNMGDLTSRHGPVNVFDPSWFGVVGSRRPENNRRAPSRRPLLRTPCRTRHGGSGVGTGKRKVQDNECLHKDHPRRPLL